MVSIVKGELGCPGGNTNERVEEACESGASDTEPRGDADRRVLRSQYLALKSLISDERDDMTRIDSDTFQSIINEVDKLQNLVQKPREQVADAEALLDITEALLASVKAHNSEGINLADFVTCLLRDFGKQSRPSGSTEDVRDTIFWKDIGLSVSHVFRRCPGCCTMIGPMNTELKQRKTCVRRKRVRPTVYIRKPREQVADAEALLDITDALLASVKAHNSEGINPADFLTCLLRDFGKQSRPSGSTEDIRDTIFWKDIGLSVSHVFRRCPGCCTMIGPMNTELKQRKTCVRRKRLRPTESAHPDGFDDAVAEERTDTDTNMSIMFNILKKNRSVKLENLVLNRNSFAQTVENLFALSFLVKDGRAEITVNEKGCHFVSPRNAPSASAVISGDAAYRHFVFRLDFKDWKLMTHSVGVGEELLLHRNQVNMSSDPEVDPPLGVSQAAVSTTPIWKLCRNRGLVLQEHSVVEGSLQSDHSEERTAAIRMHRPTANCLDGDSPLTP